MPAITGAIASGASGGGGGGITQEASLTHWWKMPSPAEASPPTAILDVATNGATRRNISVANITVASSGRTLGANTFDVYEFNGSSAKSYNTNQTTFFGDKLSICGWVKLASRSTYESIFTAGVTNGGWNDGLFLYQQIALDKLMFTSGGYSAAAGGSEATHPLPATGSWFHFAAVLDVAGGVQELYLNGSAGTSPATPVSPGTFNSSYKFSIGNLAWGTSSNNYYLDGQMSDFRIYHNFALSASDVAAIYAGDWAP